MSGDVGLGLWALQETLRLHFSQMNTCEGAVIVVIVVVVTVREENVYISETRIIEVM